MNILEIVDKAFGKIRTKENANEVKIVEGEVNKYVGGNAKSIDTLAGLNIQDAQMSALLLDAVRHDAKLATEQLVELDFMREIANAQAKFNSYLIKTGKGEITENEKFAVARDAIISKMTNETKYFGFDRNFQAETVCVQPIVSSERNPVHNRPILSKEIADAQIVDNRHFKNSRLKIEKLVEGLDDVCAVERLSEVFGDLELAKEYFEVAKRKDLSFIMQEIALYDVRTKSAEKMVEKLKTKNIEAK